MVLSCIKQIKFENRFKKIDTGFLLKEVFQRYAFYNFNVYKIKENNLYSYIEFNKEDDRPYILNPLTGKNLCQNWSCKGFEINATFFLGHSKLYSEKKSFENILKNGIEPYAEIESIDIIVNLLN